VSLAGALSRRVRVRTQTTPLEAAPSLQADIVKRVVERRDNMVDGSRIQEGYIHVSSLLSFCPRMFRLAAVDQVRVTNFPTSNDRIMWAIGRSIEHHIRSAVVETQDKRHLYGTWRCPCGNCADEGFWKPKVCNSCKMPADYYGEAAVFDHELKISGSPDILWRQQEGMLVVEIKSMNKKEFDTLDRAKANHIFQAGAYHKLMSQAGTEMAPNVSVIYGCKDYAFASSPYKEFHIPAESVYSIVEGAFEQVRILRRSEQDGNLPPKLAVCSVSTTPTAKKCPTCVNCFSR